MEHEFPVIHNKVAIKQAGIHGNRNHNNQTKITKIVTSSMLSGLGHKSIRLSVCCHKSIRLSVCHKQ